MSRSYPDTPAGRSRQLKDGDDARMKRSGHRMKWQRWRKGTLNGGGNWLSAPGWEGWCVRCGDTVHVVSLGDGTAYRSVTRADGTRCSVRKCRTGRR